jgi:hypothetical protein
MTHAYPFIASGSSPLNSPPLGPKEHVEPGLFAHTHRGRQSVRLPGRKPRARTLSPRNLDLGDKDEPIALLPATIYDPTVIYHPRTNTSTVVPSPLLPQCTPYTIIDVKESERNQIMEAFYRRYET